MSERERERECIYARACVCVHKCAWKKKKKLGIENFQKDSKLKVLLCALVMGSRWR